LRRVADSTQPVTALKVSTLGGYAIEALPRGLPAGLGGTRAQRGRRHGASRAAPAGSSSGRAMGGEEDARPFAFNFFSSAGSPTDGAGARASGPSASSGSSGAAEDEDEAAAAAAAEAAADALLSGGFGAGPVVGLGAGGGGGAWSYHEAAEELAAVPWVRPGQVRGAADSGPRRGQVLKSRRSRRADARCWRLRRLVHAEPSRGGGSMAGRGNGAVAPHNLGACLALRSGAPPPPAPPLAQAAADASGGAAATAAGAAGEAELPGTDIRLSKVKRPQPHTPPRRRRGGEQARENGRVTHRERGGRAAGAWRPPHPLPPWLWAPPTRWPQAMPHGHAHLTHTPGGPRLGHPPLSQCAVASEDAAALLGERQLQESDLVPGRYEGERRRRPAGSSAV
jgi:hypothetical protein